MKREIKHYRYYHQVLRHIVHTAPVWGLYYQGVAHQLCLAGLVHKNRISGSYRPTELGIRKLNELEDWNRANLHLSDPTIFRLSDIIPSLPKHID